MLVMYVCVLYVYVHMYVCARMYACMHVHVYNYDYIYASTCMYVGHGRPQLFWKGGGGGPG